MKHVGDITKLSGYELPVVDCIFGGSPCQDLSVAGKRAGMKHAEKGDDETTRSGLFMDQMRLVKEMRAHDRAAGRSGRFVRPRYMVWENVPGALSSPGGDHKGEDFAAVLEEIIKVAEQDAYIHVRVPDGGWTNAGCYYAEDGTWSLAWRVHDAQFWGTTQFIDGRMRFLGTPQRRRRIALVADFGGLSAPEILFERKGLSWNSDEGGEEGQGTASRTQGGARSAGKCLNPWDVQSKHIQSESGIAESLYAGECQWSGGESYVHTGESPNGEVAIPIEGNGGRPSHMGNGYGKDGDPSFTLNTIEQHGVCSPVAVDVYNQTIDGETTATVTAACGGTNTSGPKVMSYGVVSKGNGEAWITEERATTVSTGGGLPGQGYPCAMVDADPAAYGFKPRNGSGARSIGYEEEKAPTINTDENYAVLAYGFEPGAAKRLNPEERFNEELAPTLRANMGDNQVGVAVGASGFSYGQSDKAYSLGYEEEVSPTIRGGEGGNQRPCVLDSREPLAIENHPSDGRCRVSDDGIVQTLRSRMGTGGNNTPLVMEQTRAISFQERAGKPGGGKGILIQEEHTGALSTLQIQHVFSMQGNVIDRDARPNGSGISMDVSPTLNTVDRHGIAIPEAKAFAQNQRDEVRDLNDVATALHAEAGMHQQTFVVTEGRSDE